MPPPTQDLIYRNPKTGESVKWDGKSWTPIPKGAEAQSVAARPDANAQAAAALRKPIEQHQESTFVPTHSYGGGGSYVTGKPEEIEGIKNKQRVGMEAGLAAAGGEIAAPLLEGAGPVLSALGRAASSGTAAGAGAKMSGADLKDAAKTAGVFGATELGMHALFSGGEALYKLLADPKWSMQQAGQMVAEQLSKQDISPAEFGKGVQEGFDAISRKAGQAKGEFLSRVSQEHPDLTVRHTNTQKILQTEVDNLETLKRRNPDLFAQGEGLDKTLRILRSELDSTGKESAQIAAGVKKGNLADADLRRSQFWNYKQQLDPSMASRLVGQMDKAATQDITEALVRQDKKLAEEYLQASQRYHQLQNLGRAETLKAVFGDTRVAPDKVVEVFNQAPEASLQALRTLNRENPVAIENLRRQLFLQGIKTSGVRSIFKQQPELLREIYGPQSGIVSKFVDTVNSKAAGGTLLSKIPGKTGAMFRIAEAGTRSGITIRDSEMAKILKSPELTRLFTQAAEMPANSGPARLMRETLDRAIQAVGIEPGEAAVRPARKALWKGGEEPPAGSSTPPPSGNTPPAPAQGGAAAGYKGPERRIGGDLPAGTTERRTGAAERQISELRKRLQGANEEEKRIINSQIESLRTHPEDPELPARKLERKPGQGAKADPEKMKEALEAQRKRLKEFEEEYARIMQEQGGGK